MTLKEVGRRLGVTREWVRKIEIRAVRKLDDSAAAEDAAGVPARARGSANAPAPARPPRSVVARRKPPPSEWGEGEGEGSAARLSRAPHPAVPDGRSPAAPIGAAGGRLLLLRSGTG